MSETLLLGHVAPVNVPRRLAAAFDVIRMFIGPTRAAGTFRSDVTKLRGLAGPRWTVELFDLLTVMCTLRAADRFFRSRDIFAMGRDLHIACTVHDAKRWRELTPLLRHAAYRLSYDHLDFHPLHMRARAPDAKPLPQTSLAFDDAYVPDCLCLFSGGADSFCGAAHLLANGRRPLFVSVSIGGIAARQRLLFQTIRKRFPHVPERALIQLSPWPNAFRRDQRPAKGWQHRDSLQRLRSTFFFSLGAIAARSFAVEELFMCENGIVGAALTYSPVYDNATTTRPAEPRFLRAMEDFLAAHLGEPRLRIRNPFQYRTKGEVLRETAALGLGASLPRTISCWTSGNQGIHNCGVCVPCLFRQLAFAESGLRLRERYTRAAIPRGRAWPRWESAELPRLIAIRDYCERAVRDGASGLLSTEEAVMDAADVTGGPTAQRAVPLDARDELDAAAPLRMADTVLRFARATIARLP
jgi:7-cyano-7-deazaguanine synthase in queuosine biosynthesis